MKYFIITILLCMLGLQFIGAQQQRFPKPEFETGYVQPDTTTPEPRSLALEWVDVALLTIMLSALAYLVLKKRSRNWVLLISLFTFAYFGFYRKGCICPVGSVQNVALSLFDSNYAISLTVLAFFILPLAFTLLFGRVFCAGACPLGVIQDLVVVKPMTVPGWLQKVLGLFPVVYLSLAVLYAATGTDFIICRYDPFVGIYRLGAGFNMVVLGICFLVIGMFIARPYCRFICPYGVLLQWFSVFAWKHLSITPSKCIQCKLCSNACPFDAIDTPGNEKEIKKQAQSTKKFIVYAVLIPVWIGAFGWMLSQSAPVLSRANSTVHLAEILAKNPELIKQSNNLDIKTFAASGKTLDTLIDEAKLIQADFKKMGWFIGGFLGLVFGFSLLNQLVYRQRTDYQPNKGDCVSCGRCFKFCPVKK